MAWSSETLFHQPLFTPRHDINELFAASPRFPRPFLRYFLPPCWRFHRIDSRHDGNRFCSRSSSSVVTPQFEAWFYPRRHTDCYRWWWIQSGGGNPVDGRFQRVGFCFLLFLLLFSFVVISRTYYIIIRILIEYLDEASRTRNNKAIRYISGSKVGIGGWIAGDNNVRSRNEWLIPRSIPIILPTTYRFSVRVAHHPSLPPFSFLEIIPRCVVTLARS